MSIFSRLRYYLAVLILVALPSCGGGNVGTGADYKGQVKSALSNEGLSAAEVQISVDGRVVAQDITDSEGNYATQGNRPEPGQVLAYTVLLPDHAEVPINVSTVFDSELSVEDNLLIQTNLLLTGGLEEQSLIIESIAVSLLNTPTPTPTLGPTVTPPVSGSIAPTPTETPNIELSQTSTATPTNTSSPEITQDPNPPDPPTSTPTPTPTESGQPIA